MKLSALFVTLLAACSCAGVQRNPQTMHEATVRIETTCGDGPDAQKFWGSGTLVADDLVLTANHVVQCEIIPGVPIYVTPTKVTVNPGGDKEHLADVELTFGDGIKDIARLKLRDKSLGKYMSPVRVGPTPKIGDTVCESAAVPRWTFRCGTIQPSDGYIRFEGRVEHGNSGSGLYNSRGELVGVVVQLWLCEDHSFCGGRAAPIQQWPWLTP